jgi:hypothetical protein
VELTDPPEAEPPQPVAANNEVASNNVKDVFTATMVSTSDRAIPDADVIVMRILHTAIRKNIQPVNR